MFGVRQDKPKLSDYCGAFRQGAGTLPASYRLPKECIPDCRDQGSVSSCVGFAVTNIMQILNQKETGKRLRFSAGYVYGRCRDEGDSYQGMFPRKTLDYLRKTGACEERDFPDTVEMPEIRRRVLSRPDLDEKAAPYRIRGYEIYNQAEAGKKTESIKRALYETGTPVLVSTLAYGEPHAVCIIGWDDERKQYEIMNSWGDTAGDGGICRIPYNSIDWGYLLLDEKNGARLMPFLDVAKDTWYYGAVEKVYNTGLMKGKSETTFEPDKPMTRAEMAQVLSNLLAKLDGGGA